jgi:hypothetical protein
MKKEYFKNRLTLELASIKLIITMMKESDLFSSKDIVNVEKARDKLQQAILELEDNYANEL